tara:strand:+ start:2126 stop:2761 length:636 start_codon:yes stop_codon:yes gene_type:complete
MHITSLVAGEEFANTYIDFTKLGKLVIDVGGQDVNGSLREYYENKGLKYICVDIAEHKSVDVVIKLGDKLPFKDSSVDYIISNSAFEHDPCFWMTFKEMTRIIKEDGFIYVNSPSSGPYHPYVTDNYRFYADAGQALAYWSGIQVVNELVFPVKVVETFNILGTEWKDFCCIWKRTKNKEISHILPEDIVKTKGKLEKAVNMRGYETIKKS